MRVFTNNVELLNRAVLEKFQKLLYNMRYLSTHLDTIDRADGYCTDKDKTVFRTMKGHNINDDAHQGYGELIPVEIFLSDNYPPKPEVQLNEKYIAIVDKVNSVVNVGCQKFTFDKITELYKTINE